MTETPDRRACLDCNAPLGGCRSKRCAKCRREHNRQRKATAARKRLARQFAVCQRCGKHFTPARSGPVSPRCLDCQRDHHRDYCRRWSEEHQPDPVDAGLLDVPLIEQLEDRPLEPLPVEHPTPEEIAERSAAIQAGWTEREEAARRRWSIAAPLVLSYRIETRHRTGRPVFAAK